MGGMGMGGMNPGFGGGMSMSMGMGLGMGAMNMGGVSQGDDAYQFDLNLDHIKAIEPPKSDPKNFKGKEKGGILKDPSKKKQKKEVKIGNTETIHYERESSHYSSGQDGKKASEDEEDSDESDDVQNTALAKVTAISSKKEQALKDTLDKKEAQPKQPENKI